MSHSLIGRGLLRDVALAVIALVVAGAAAHAAPQPAAGPPMTAEERGRHIAEIIALTKSAPRPTAPAASVPRAFGHADFSGLWKEDQGVLFSDPTPGAFGGKHPGWDDTINPPPYNPEWAQKYIDYKANAAAKGKGPARIYDCDPSGMPRLMSNPFPMELIQTKDKLVMLFEYKSQIRRAYMDGRPHPSEDDYDASYTGHSTAKWEGETLVIDTTRIGDFPGKLSQGTGIKNSADLHIVERVRYLTPNQIEWEITMIDPVAFTKPWVARRSFTRQSLAKNIPEYECTLHEVLGELGYDSLPPKK